MERRDVDSAFAATGLEPRSLAAIGYRACGCRSGLTMYSVERGLHDREYGRVCGGSVRFWRRVGRYFEVIVFGWVGAGSTLLLGHHCAERRKEDLPCGISIMIRFVPSCVYTGWSQMLVVYFILQSAYDLHKSSRRRVRRRRYVQRLVWQEANVPEYRVRVYNNNLLPLANFCKQLLRLFIVLIQQLGHGC